MKFEASDFFFESSIFLSFRFAIGLELESLWFLEAAFLLKEKKNPRLSIF